VIKSDVMCVYVCVCHVCVYAMYVCMYVLYVCYVCAYVLYVCCMCAMCVHMCAVCVLCVCICVLYVCYVCAMYVCMPCMCVIQSLCVCQKCSDREKVLRKWIYAKTVKSTWKPWKPWNPWKPLKTGVYYRPLYTTFHFANDRPSGGPILGFRCTTPHETVFFVGFFLIIPLFFTLFHFSRSVPGPTALFRFFFMSGMVYGFPKSALFYTFFHFFSFFFTFFHFFSLLVVLCTLYVFWRVFMPNRVFRVFSCFHWLFLDFGFRFWICLAFHLPGICWLVLAVGSLRPTYLGR
jgi:hypothetical protein